MELNDKTELVFKYMGVDNMTTYNRQLSNLARASQRSPQDTNALQASQASQASQARKNAVKARERLNDLLDDLYSETLDNALYAREFALTHNMGVLQ